MSKFNVEYQNNLEFIKKYNNKIDCNILEDFINKALNYSVVDYSDDEVKKLKFQIFEFGATLNHPRCLHNYGYCFYSGYCVEKDLDKAYELFEKAAKLEYLESEFMLGVNIFAKTFDKNIEIGLKYTTSAASKGHTKAQFRLAMEYIIGENIEINIKEALRYAKLCNSQGCEGSDSLLTYVIGKKQLFEDLEYLNTIKSNDDNEEDINKIAKLAVDYYFGYNNKNYFDEYPLEFVWYAFEKNHCDGKLIMGVCIEEGYVEGDLNIAFKYVLESKKEGSKYANGILAMYYKNGIGCDVDLNLFYEISKDGIKLNDGLSISNCAMCFEEGVIVDLDFDKASEYYKLATSFGYDCEDDIKRIEYKKYNALITESEIKSTNKKLLTNYEEKGFIFNINNSEAILEKYTGDDTRVIIPKEIKKDGKIYLVTKIKESCFSNTYITNIVIPNDVYEIGNNAFSCCRVLTNVLLPDNLVELGERAFIDCDCLLEITIPNKLIKIKKETFKYCDLLKTVILNNVEVIDEESFEGCINLEEVIGINNKIAINEKAFINCDKLKLNFTKN